MPHQGKRNGTNFDSLPTGTLEQIPARERSAPANEILCGHVHWWVIPISEWPWPLASGTSNCQIDHLFIELVQRRHCVETPCTYVLYLAVGADLAASIEEPQGVPRVINALHSHMWSGLERKDPSAPQPLTTPGTNSLSCAKVFVLPVFVESGNNVQAHAAVSYWADADEAVSTACTANRSATPLVSATWSVFDLYISLMMSPDFPIKKSIRCAAIAISLCFVA